MSKNIIMQQKTASGYQELYPKTDVGQITGMEEYDWKVGDIRSTARNDLGEKWLLCNGATIFENSYPELDEHFEQKFVYAGALNTEAVAQLRRVVGSGDQYIVLTDKWIVAGTNLINVNSNWIKQQTFSDVMDAFCYNGLWACVTKKYNNFSYVYCSTNPMLYNSWTSRTIGQEDLVGIYCYGGLWVAIGLYSIYYTTNPTDQWTQKNLNVSNFTPASIICNEGQWVIAGYNTSTQKLSIITTADPTGEWTLYDIISISNPLNNNRATIPIAYGNGQWAIAYKDDRYNVKVCFTTELAGMWTHVTAGGRISIEIGGLIYSNGIWRVLYYYVNGYVYVSETKELTGEWARKGVMVESNYGGRITCGNNLVVAVLANNAVSLYNYVISLPTITIDNAYAYIKVKS